ncbi:MAG TPA: hypothetical protein PLY34_14115 [Ferruginibacter sp.]|nr:hypothetical protein [Ferruginibacter sp.]HPH92001.1 hypothetical protein [Ferruginibacter sp.]
MPQSKKRQHHHQQHQHPHVPGNPQPATSSNKVTNAGMIFFAILGLLISYFMAGSDIKWLIAGAVGGGAIGYLFARQMNRTFSKK